MKKSETLADNFWSSKRTYIVGAILLGVVSFGGLYAFAKSQSNNASEKSSTGNCVEATCVSLKSGGAVPNEVIIKNGGFVQFNSSDGKTHQLSLGEGGSEHDHSGPFHSPKIKSDEGWRVQFKEDGSYFFHDHFNPDINVLVVIYSEGKDYKITR